MSTWAGNLIRLARRDLGLSQRDLARKAGTSQAAIAADEAGKRSPTLETLARIIRAAGLDLRIQLAPADSHDEWLALYERSLPREVVEASRKRDRALVEQARSERVAKAGSSR
ncbi:MAG: helix-turn-helix domain-containing protein [Actinobacteria bacterium]|nr:helix-turn-helix domain-containing protein [Actinomycetota bacterium]